MTEKPIPAHVRRVVELWHMRKTYKEIIAILEAEGIRISKRSIKRYIGEYADLTNEFGHRETFTANQLIDYKITPCGGNYEHEEAF